MAVTTDPATAPPPTTAVRGELVVGFAGVLINGRRIAIGQMLSAIVLDKRHGS
jgi:hypothetical protein